MTEQQLAELHNHIATLNELIDGDTEDELGSTLNQINEFLKSLIPTNDN